MLYIGKLLHSYICWFVLFFICWSASIRHDLTIDMINEHGVIVTTDYMQHGMLRYQPLPLHIFVTNLIKLWMSMPLGERLIVSML
jgi:hypothetical protein